MPEYIERDKVLSKEEFFGEHDTWDNPMADGCMAVRSDFIMNLPAADVAPVRHGRWVKATGMMPPEYCGLHICSECGHYAGRKPPYGGREMLSDYCPNCGARMDGETNG